MFMAFRGHLSYEAKGQRPWLLISSTAAMKCFIGARKAARPFLSHSVPLTPPFPPVPTTKTLVHTRSVSCLDPCHLLLLDFLSFAS